MSAENDDEKGNEIEIICVRFMCPVIMCDQHLQRYFKVHANSDFSGLPLIDAIWF